MNGYVPQFNAALIEEIRAELGPRYEYTQHVNGYGVLICCVVDVETKRSVVSNVGGPPKLDARRMVEMLREPLKSSA